MKLLFDPNLSAKLCGLLSDVCAGSQHVRVDLGLHESPDEVIWAYALEYGFVVVSKDDDFRQLSAVRGAPPKVLCLDIGNTPTAFVAALLRRNLELIAEFVADPEAALLVLTRDHG